MVCYNCPMKRFFCSILVSAICLLSLSLNAAETSGLYTALVPLDGHSEKERQRAIKQGLLDVLVKVTGDRSIGRHKSVVSMLQRSGQYVASFGYENLNAGEFQQALKVKYIEKSVNQVIKSNQLPVWPVNRPDLLTWIVIDTPETGRTFLSRDDTSETTYNHIDKLFSARGMNVVYPLLDLQDNMTLPAEEAWSLNQELMSSASKRYPVTAWLLVRAYKTSAGTWKSAWLMAEGAETYFNESDGEDLTTLLSGIVDSSIDRMAEKYTYIPSYVSRELTLQISNIQSFEQYAAMRKLLEGLSMISRSSVKSLNGSQVVVDLSIEGDIGPFIDTLKLSQKVSVPEQSYFPANSIDIEWDPS